MSYDLTKPCANCPFLRMGGVRLTRGRTREIAQNMLSPNGNEFYCHQTLDYENEDVDGDCAGEPTDKTQHCAGALIFAEKNGTETQMMRICHRIGLYHPDDLQDSDKVFDTLEEMLNHALHR